MKWCKYHLELGNIFNFYSKIINQNCKSRFIEPKWEENEKHSRDSMQRSTGPTCRGNLQSARTARWSQSCLPSSPSSSSCLPFSSDLLRLSSAFGSLLWPLSSFSLAISTLLRWTKAVVWVLLPLHCILMSYFSILTWTPLPFAGLCSAPQSHCPYQQPGSRRILQQFPGEQAKHAWPSCTLRGFCGAYCSLKSQRDELHEHHPAPVRIWTNQKVWLNRRKVGGSVWTFKRFKYFFHVSVDNV